MIINDIDVSKKLSCVDFEDTMVYISSLSEEKQVVLLLEIIDNDYNYNVNSEVTDIIEGNMLGLFDSHIFTVANNKQLEERAIEIAQVNNATLKNNI